jgi:hypothetical protein
MALSELLPALKALPRSEKIRAIQALADDLASEEENPLAEVEGKSCPVWSPYEAFGAAAKLLQVQAPP